MHELLDNLEADVKALKEYCEFTYCAFCGEQFLADDKSAADKVTKHIKTCQEHPLHSLYEQLKRLEDSCWISKERMPDENIVTCTLRVLETQADRIQELEAKLSHVE